jgi:hypothetical protein
LSEGGIEADAPDADQPGRTNGRNRMLLKIVIVGALLLGGMAVIRDGRVLKDAGLLSKCNAVTTDAKSDPTLLSCSKGRLDGWPDMSAQSCNLIAVHPSREYWRCAAPVVSSQTPNG